MYNHKMITNSINDTIFALSTPVGGAIAVIRASGELAIPVLESIFSGRVEHRRLSHGFIRDDTIVLDEAMAVCFRAPQSYTGEDMFELNLHGSYAVVSSVASLLMKKGIRRAEAGEFTRRAFANGKMDLIQADAVMDLVRSETQLGASTALEQLSGGLSRRINRVEEILFDIASEISAAMDYPDEMEDEVLHSIPEALEKAENMFHELVANGNCNRIIREGARLVILGCPNVGKSSLMNTLMNTDRAIVTPVAGTTRDILEESIDINGLPVRLVDTAGIHSTLDSVERIGIERARAQTRTAELVLLMFDGSRTLTAQDMELAADSKDLPRLLIVNKCDAESKERDVHEELNVLYADEALYDISCKTGEGIRELKQAIAMRLCTSEGRAIVTNARHIECMKAALADLEDVHSLEQMDLIAGGIESALMHLGEITGREVSEELLDRIFERFCVGK